ncbi:MAG TPA: 1-deoxy-D-xylulose-5-phosphate reductoisomerase [Acidimicrobiales bacterium]|jgi:1-deoxy-D-xylulose-5-phosphate reductoisomerase|nr:1-deoxy-D-xylulose-5-phosphate reductoisomerase [Acidimicrobiales bacterium]|tara:strand:+ start:3621 stop:4775 length:1155 start_codon:yes stop_codon:yes gene_type:complete
MATKVSVLGSTGSIGTQTLEIIDSCPEDYEVVSLGAAQSVEKLTEQAIRLRPKVVAIEDPELVSDLADRLPAEVEILAGPNALSEAAVMGDVAINGVVGFAGLPITMAVLQAGNRLGLANKESLIAAGPIVQRVRDTPGAELLPVDSEHCAIHQCLRANVVERRVKKIVLTASGGPFRGRKLDQLSTIGVEEALDHPTWSMGPKITVDSSTLMNKGLEVIEAHELFGTDYNDIEVVVHPQSIIHSMVAFSDGATIAQLSLPDMRLCIGYALAYPDRLEVPFGEIDWTQLNRLDFELPDRKAFRCLDLAFAAGEMGETAPAWLNAANEVAVASFLENKLSWIGISEVLEEILNIWPGEKASKIEDILEVDQESRRITSELILKKT